MTWFAILRNLQGGMVQVCNDQEKTQSERDSHSKNRGGHVVVVVFFLFSLEKLLYVTNVHNIT